MERYIHGTLGEELAEGQSSKGCDQWCSSVFVSRARPVHIFINNPDAGFGCTISKFAEDTKMGDVVCFFERQKAL